MEIYIIIGVIVVQILVTLRAMGKIRNLKHAVPSKGKYRLESYSIKMKPSEEDSLDVTIHKINTSTLQKEFTSIAVSINEYLKNNKGATADMSLLSNIVKRNIATLENEIGILIPIPLYLGLIGTMAGIIFGLFNIPSVGDVGFSDGVGIDILIGGVKYAMIASVAGIIFTTVLSGWYFRNAKYAVESNTNEFLTFLETKLLPVLKADVSTNLHMLYQNLASFNHRFEKGVSRLSGIMDKTHDAVLSQVKLIDELQRIDLNQMAAVNIKIFEEMRRLMPQFESLNSYVTGINQSIVVSEELSAKITGILNRTNEVGKITTFLQESTNKSIQLNEIVEQHFQELEDRNQEFVLATNNMEDKAKLAIDHFKTFIEEQIKALKGVTLREEDLLLKAFEDNRNVLGKLNELTEIKNVLKKISEKPEKEIDFSKEFDRLIKEIQNKDLNFSIEKNKLKLKQAGFSYRTLKAKIVAIFGYGKRLFRINTGRK